MGSRLRMATEDIARRVNSDPKIREALKRWISTYDGKVVGFRVGGSIERSEWRERFHIILPREGAARVGEGDYPSPEVVFLIENEADGVEMFKNPGRALEMIKTGRIWIMANMNEAFPFFNEVVSRCSDVVKKHLEGPS